MGRYGMLCSLLVMAVAGASQAGPKVNPTEHIYKTVDGFDLRLQVFAPPRTEGDSPRPAIVFFHGGGWAQGRPDQFIPHCQYLATRGLVAVTAEYRLYGKHDARIIDAVADAKSAMRWVRSHADTLGVDPDRLLAGGGSAGGHLAACTAVVEGHDDPNDDLSVSPRPAALVLFNPVASIVPTDAEPANKFNWIIRRAGVDAIEISPAHHVDDDVPPTVMFFGTEDGFLPGARLFQQRMQAQGNRCALLTWEGESHGFFNVGRNGFAPTLEAADRFLQSLGYLQGDPTVDAWIK